MKERISNEIYIAVAKPITEILWNGCRRTGNIEKAFIINPIIGKPFIGKERIIGAVEAVSKEKLFDYNCYSNDFDGTVEVFSDDKGHGNQAGDVLWNADFRNEANRMVPQKVLEDYFAESSDEKRMQIEKFREDCMEYARQDKYCRVLRKLL